MITICEVTLEKDRANVPHQQQLLDRCRTLVGQPIVQAATGRVGVIEATYVKDGKVLLRAFYREDSRHDHAGH